MGEFWEGNGYGYATRMIMNSLTRLGYDWRPNDESADVEIWFDQPRFWKFSEGPYKIGYHPWESTELPPGWADIMNECDEIWTPSPLIADWYTKYSGITKPVYVFEHGVDKVWAPYKRTANKPFNFLHIGAEALRKGFRETSAAYRENFGYGSDTVMDFKLQNEGWGIRSGQFGINYLNASLDLADLLKVYHEHNVFVYPSWGEGFGLTPLQAMATGMPTITVPGWAPYAQFLNPNLSVGSELSEPPRDHIMYQQWKECHPGLMLKPNHDDLVKAMAYAYENYDEVVADAMDKADAIRDHYDWDRLTSEAFKNLSMRLENS